MTGHVVGLLVAAAAVLAAPVSAVSIVNKPPPARIPSPISISRVRLDVSGSRVLTTTDIMLPAARQPFETLDVHVASGGPGAPLGFDAQLLEIPKGYLSAPLHAVGTKLSTVLDYHSPSYAAFCVGRPEMAGNVVHMPASVLADVLRGTGQATLRLREVRDLPVAMADGTREVLVRLGAVRASPFVLGTVEVASNTSAARMQARFCGVHRVDAELFVAGAPTMTGAVAPPLAPRSPNDDLCVRFGPAVDAPAVSSTTSP